MFSDKTDDEFLELYSNKFTPRPKVGSSRHRQQHGERWVEDPDEVAMMGMDIGDYQYIDSIMHCPMVDWVQQGKLLKQLKNQQDCGSCWAHSTLAAVENLYARENYIDDPEEIPSLSE